MSSGLFRVTPGARAVAAARAVVGARFRLHGRDPESGLDCVGLAALALRAEGFEGPVPLGYAMRSGDAARVHRAIAAAGLVVAERRLGGAALPGASRRDVR